MAIMIGRRDGEPLAALLYRRGMGKRRGEQRADRAVSGILYTVLATLLLTVGLYLPRLISSNADPVQVSFLRYAGGTLWLVAIYCVRRRGGRAALFSGADLTTQAWHIARAVVGFGTLTLTVMASRLLPIGNVQAILACNGLLVLVWLILRGIERIQGSVIVGTLLCVTGALLASNVKVTMHEMVGYGAAWAACACWATEIVIFRHAVVRSPGKTSLLFINLVGVILLIVPGVLRWHSVPVTHCLLLLSVGVILVASQAALIKALERVPLSVTVPFRYLNVPAALLLGFLVLNQTPSLVELAGAALVMIGGTVLSERLARKTA
ncbi:DMT family transporter [Paraburkholderia denitrificans]|uniref:DMT family transporter n=1 Tax=Paraburkholderia denitrificans TaxID=694025 RepID=A0ABW0J6Y5_9BURK